jgi:hypothetical protein
MLLYASCATSSPPDTSTTADVAAPEGAETCDMTSYLMGYSRDEKPDLGPLLAPLQDTFDDTVTVCAQPVKNQDDTCAEWIARTEGNDELMGFLIYNNDTGQLSESLVVAPQTLVRHERPPCSDEGREGFTKALCDAQALAYLDGFFQRADTRHPENLVARREVFFDDSGPFTTCQGFGVVRVATSAGAPEDQWVSFHTLFSIRSHDTHMDMLTLTMMRMGPDVSDAILDTQQYLASVLHDAMGGLDVSKRLYNTRVFDTRSPRPDSNEGPAPPRR